MIKQARLLFPFLAFFVIWLFLLVTVFSMQVVDSETYHRQSENNAFKNKHVFGDRGKIMDRNGVVLADILQKKNDKDEIVYERVYPMGRLASQLIGKMGNGASGAFGLEKTFDDKLKGKVGLTRQAVAVGNVGSEVVYGLSKEVAEAVPGKNLVLTIDASIQEAVENVLKEGYEEYEPKGVSAVVVDPMNGDILAAASYPTFNPNDKNSGVGDSTKCGIFTFVYEPGSTFKVLTALAGLEENVVTTTEMFDDEHGCWKVPGGEICEHGKHDLGVLNMVEGMAKSSNIVYGKIAERVGKENFYRFARNFGLGSKTSSDSDLPGEEKGMLRKPHDPLWSGRTLQTMGFGHEIMVTPIQMAMIYAAVANGGNLMEPRIVLEWRDSSGKVLEKKNPSVIRRMVSEQTAAEVREMLMGVVNSGTGTKVNSKLLPELVFGGKTGTAEKYGKDGKVDRNRQVASFIGLAPALNPKYVCLVLVDEPAKGKAGGSSAGPMFRRIMERIYFNPSTSPKSHRMLAEPEKRKCEKAWNGMSIDKAQALAEQNSCSLNVVGTGDVVLSSVLESADSVTLMLGSDRIVEMPNLNGMSLKDALKVLGNARLQVEFSGKGRVAQQYPKPSEKIERGQVCKLVLKEKV